jgi:CHASE2 domain-containing sensor protein
LETIGAILIFAGAASFIAQWSIEPRSDILGLYWIMATTGLIAAGVVLIAIEQPYKPVRSPMESVAAAPIAGSPLNAQRIDRAFDLITGEEQ